MKLATLRRSGRDGCLVVVSHDLRRCLPMPDIAPRLQAVLDNWADLEADLRKVYEALDWHSPHGEPFDQATAHCPLPRAYHWVDGSA